jgi:hypothetical protein
MLKMVVWHTDRESRGQLLEDAELLIALKVMVITLSCACPELLCADGMSKNMTRALQLIQNKLRRKYTGHTSHTK